MKYAFRNCKAALAATCVATLGLAGAGAQDAAPDAKLAQALGFAAQGTTEVEVRSLD